MAAASFRYGLTIAGAVLLVTGTLCFAWWSDGEVGSAGGARLPPPRDAEAVPSSSSSSSALLRSVSFFCCGIGGILLIFGLLWSVKANARVVSRRYQYHFPRDLQYFTAEPAEKWNCSSWDSSAIPTYEEALTCRPAQAAPAFVQPPGRKEEPTPPLYRYLEEEEEEEGTQPPPPEGHRAVPAVPGLVPVSHFHYISWNQPGRGLAKSFFLWGGSFLFGLKFRDLQTVPFGVGWGNCQGLAPVAPQLCPPVAPGPGQLPVGPWVCVVPQLLPRKLCGHGGLPWSRALPEGWRGLGTGRELQLAQHPQFPLGVLTVTCHQFTESQQGPLGTIQPSLGQGTRGRVRVGLGCPQRGKPQTLLRALPPQGKKFFLELRWGLLCLFMAKPCQGGC
nr:transmembrane protein 61 isoform X2 [Zonotrichia albicollis]